MYLRKRRGLIYPTRNPHQPQRYQSSLRNIKRSGKIAAWIDGVHRRRGEHVQEYSRKAHMASIGGCKNENMMLRSLAASVSGSGLVIGRRVLLIAKR
jgi:hypothetical protein